MNTPQKSLPDYTCWSKLDTWTLKNAALLLHALDPLGYQSVKFNLHQFTLSERVNAYSIAQAMLDKAQELNIETEGLKSCNRKIAEALNFLEEEIN